MAEEPTVAGRGLRYGLRLTITGIRKGGDGGIQDETRTPTRGACEGMSQLDKIPSNSGYTIDSLNFL